MIVGHARSGKDTVGSLLKKMYEYRVDSSSSFVAEKVMMPAFKNATIIPYEPGKKPHLAPRYRSVEECFEDRANWRKFWYDEICKYCTPDKARLVREILAENDAYVGIRQVREFFCAKNEKLFQHSIWIDASERVPQEGRDSMQMEPWMCDFWLDNNGSIRDLSNNLGILMEKSILPQWAAFHAPQTTFGRMPR